MEQQSTPPPPKRRPGNPNFQKGKKNTYYDGDNQKKPEPMAEETTTETGNSTQAPEPEPKKTIVNEDASNIAQSTPVADDNALPFNIFDDTIPGTEELPLDGEVKTNNYGQLGGDNNPPPGGGNGNGAGTPPPTGGPGATGVPPIGNPSGPSGVDPNAGAGGGSQPGVSQIKTPDEIRTEAEQMVKFMLKGYEKLHGLGRWAGKVSPEKLNEEHLSGKIDLNLRLPVGKKGTDVSVKEFFNDYNESIDENIVVTNEFKEAVTPPLVRIAIKRGWAMGDELFVGMLVAEDLATKASMLIGLKSAANLILDACHQIMKKQNEKEAKREEKKKEPMPDPNQPEDVSFEDMSHDNGWAEEEAGTH